MTNHIQPGDTVTVTIHQAKTERIDEGKAIWLKIPDVADEIRIPIMDEYGQPPLDITVTPRPAPEHWPAQPADTWYLQPNDGTARSLWCAMRSPRGEVWLCDAQAHGGRWLPAEEVRALGTLTLAHREDPRGHQAAYESAEHAAYGGVQ